jgi:cation-transporting P-type ATPase 13A2
LVPGDVIEIHEKLLMPCDAIIISGQCIVNERFDFIISIKSMLTGESIPIVKTPLAKQNEIYSDKFKINTLYSGTEVLSSNTTTRAYVYRTGFFTAKGNLLLSILYPKSSHFSLYSDSLKFVAFMSMFAFLGVIYSSIVLYLQNATLWDRVIKVLDVITIAVPPSLPLGNFFIFTLL